jgi:hypothetical protein
MDLDTENSLLRRRLRAIEKLVRMVLDGHEAVTKDERHEPELRDVERMARGHKPQTDAGLDVWKQAADNL